MQQSGGEDGERKMPGAQHPATALMNWSGVTKPRRHWQVHLSQAQGLGRTEVCRWPFLWRGFRARLGEPPANIPVRKFLADIDDFDGDFKR